MTRQAMVILGKEIREGLRDRRAASAALAYALIGPAVLFAVLIILDRTSTAATDVRVRMVGVAAAPGLLGALTERGFVQSNSADIVLDMSKDFAEALAKNEPARMFIDADMAKRSAAVARLRAAVAAWGDGVAAQRLVARGVAPGLARPLRVDVRDRGTIGPTARLIVDAIAFIILAAPFFGGIALASDATAGERERYSLAPLLQQPVDVVDVILGKWLAIGAASLAGTIATVLGMAVVMRSSVAASIGIQVTFDAVATVRLLAALLPLTAAVSALQLLVGLGTRSYKEGQTYLTLLSFVPFLALMFARSPRGEAWVGRPVAFLWDVGAITRVLSGEVVPAWLAAGAVLIYALLTAALLVAGTQQLRRLAERDA